MKHYDAKEYLTPEVTVLQLETELAFLGSNMESIENEKPEQEW